MSGLSETVGAHNLTSSGNFMFTGKGKYLLAKQYVNKHILRNLIYLTYYCP